MASDNALRIRVNQTAGAATFEFLLALPLLTFTFCFLVQFAVLLHVKTIVDHAAYCAARSAAVWAPRQTDETMERVHRAAALACVAASPPLEMFGSDGQRPADLPQMPYLSTVPGVAELSRMYGNWAYAFNATQVAVEFGELRRGAAVVTNGPIVRAVPASPAASTVGAIPMVTARVQYKAFLFVPLAGPLLGHAVPPEGASRLWGGFTEIRSACSLALEEERLGVGGD